MNDLAHQILLQIFRPTNDNRLVLIFFYFLSTYIDLPTCLRNFAVAAQTDVVFQVTDALLQKVTSPPITVIADLTILFPTTPESGVTQSIQWKGGAAPYTAYVLSVDVSRSVFRALAPILHLSNPDRLQSLQ